MRALVVCCLLATLGALPSRLAAQRVPPPTASAATARQLLRYEDGWAAALVRRDATYFQRMLAPGFVYTEDSTLMTRAEVLRSATAGADTVTAARNEAMAVHVAGPVTAVVTGILVVQGRSSGRAYTHRYRFTDTWVRRRDGRWQMVAAHDYLIPTR